MEEISWRQVEPGMRIAVHRDGSGFAASVIEVQRHPEEFEWRTVTGRNSDGPTIDKGGPGVNGPAVVVGRAR